MHLSDIFLKRKEMLKIYTYLCLPKIIFGVSRPHSDSILLKFFEFSFEISKSRVGIVSVESIKLGNKSHLKRDDLQVMLKEPFYRPTQTPINYAET